MEAGKRARQGHTVGARGAEQAEAMAYAAAWDHSQEMARGREAWSEARTAERCAAMFRQIADGGEPSAVLTDFMDRFGVDADTLESSYRYWTIDCE